MGRSKRIFPDDCNPLEGRERIAIEPCACSKIAGLLPAAGRSTRMGASNKLVDSLTSGVAFSDGAMVRKVAKEMVSARLHPIKVVTGYEAQRVERALKGLDLHLVHNEDYHEGMGASLRCGFAALPADIDAAIVCLGDMPLIRARHIERLAKAFDPSAGCEICVPVFDGRRGNPVLFSKRFFPEMATLRGDVGGRGMVERYERFVFELPMDDAAVLVDIDSPEDIAHAAEIVATEERDRWNNGR
ncbi:nucleotidyltransferase family protein [Thioalkalivibrio sp. HK1]|uniref:nucleotidyltransferase family protein n=1 Tax=Thioalkalivibrio sp. HK1 TaxID=1469245 RepID=UPI00046F527A|nr:nucleotidyltransferase family protein [Thioalkalivibrio sp. HK1]